MKKIALIAFLLAVCVAAGRAQESRQDISISGTGSLSRSSPRPPTFRCTRTTAYGALASYRFMLTPSSAVEANYGITYQNKIHYVISNTNNYIVHDPHPGDLGRLRALLQLPQIQSVCRGRPGGIDLPAHPQLRHHHAGRKAADRASAASTEPASPTRSAPASTFAPSIADWSPRCRPSAIHSSTPTSGTTSTTPPSAWLITFSAMSMRFRNPIEPWVPQVPRIWGPGKARNHQDHGTRAARAQRTTKGTGGSLSPFRFSYCINRLKPALYLSTSLYSRSSR